ncbi:peptidylprolyl isomerase [Peptacetobacter hominis]|uniref:Peptidylprolyl isomerase n=1 Tax=Peptacetobacter hominis TaxID=2743610 RepID=A0A544QTI8_9FIRM|nr:peptidylprolyl isomerase [Peptacetobacter hominis]TQQ84006.1 peptidylprolyl isomerase [Peptacetobacter hominis]
MKKRILALVTAGILAFSLAGCSGTKDPNAVAATVNGEEITLGQLEFMLRMNKSSVEASMTDESMWEQEIEDGVTYRDKFKELMIDQMVNTALIAQAAEKDGLKPSDKEVESSYNELRTTINSDEDLKKSAEELGVTDEFLKSQAKTNLLIQAYQNKFNEETKVSESEMEKYYEENKDSYKVDEVEASHILIKITDDDGNAMSDADKKKAKAKAEKILKEVKNGGDFAELAKKYSEDPGSAENGGSLGTFGKGQMVEPFEEAAFSMEPGEISDLVETDYGYHIIKVTDKINKTTSYEEAKDGIKTQLLNNMYGEKIEELQKDAKIEKDTKIIDSAEF